MAFHDRFSTYFDREVAQHAARSLANGVGIEFRIRDDVGSSEEVFHFTREAGRNKVVAGPAVTPEVVFQIPPAAAEQILADPSEEIAAIGIHIAKLMVSTDANLRVSARLKVGFFGLFTQGYLGVLKEGGTGFAAFLASKGLTGIDAIKTVIKKLKGSA